MLGTLAVLVLARRLGPHDLGVWAMVLAVQGYALHAGEFGLRSVATAVGATVLGGPKALIWPYLKLRLVTTTTTVAGVMLLTAALVPAQLPLVGLALLSLYLIGLQLDWVPLVEGRPYAATLPLVARPAIFTAALLSWPGSLQPVDVAAAFVIAWAAAAAIAALALARTQPASGTAPIPAASAFLRRGRGFFAVTFINQLQLGLDTLVVGAVLGADQAGIYFLGIGVATAGLVFANAAGQLALAQAARADGAAILRHARQAMIYGCILSPALAAAGPWLLPFLFGRDFAGAGQILIALAPFLALAHGTAVLQPSLGAAGRQADVVRINLYLLPALTGGLLAAALVGEPVAFAVARSLAEAMRLALLWRAARTLASPVAPDELHRPSLGHA